MSYRSDLVLIANSILALSTTISIAIRFAKTQGNKPTLDLQNGMLCLAAFCGVSMSILQCIETRYGLGLHVEDVSANEMQQFLKLFMPLMCFYLACNMFVKFALLIFYKAITYERYHRWAIWFMEFVAFGFGLSSILVVIFQCKPLSKAMYPATPGSCLNLIPFLRANAWIMIGNDIVLYLMPIIFTWNLQIRRPQRIALNLLFALGALVVATSVIRLCAFERYAREGDLTWNYPAVLIWSSVENHLAIFIACAPSIKALVSATIVPRLSASYGSLKEKIISSVSSQSTSMDRSRQDSCNPAAAPVELVTIGSKPTGFATKMLDRLSSARRSIDSDDSGFEHITSARRLSSIARTNSASSLESASRTVSEAEEGFRGPQFTVYAIDDLEVGPHQTVVYAERGHDSQ